MEAIFCRQVLSVVTSTALGAFTPKSLADSVFTSDPNGSLISISPSTSTAPQVHVSPASLVLVSGDRGSLAALASGDAPLSYQWRFNGTNIPGKISDTLLLENITAADAGSYTVVVTNSQGSVESNAGVLLFDSDGDDLPDTWEQAMFGSLTETGTGDYDNDGRTNATEYAGGTNPKDALPNLQVTTDSGGDFEYGYAVATQADGKIVMAGTRFSTTGTDWDFAVLRYNTDGTLDTTFGTGGQVFTPVGSLDDYGRAVAIQSDGKILVAGYAWDGPRKYELAVVRYNTNGTLDTSFSGDGKVMTSVGFGDDVGRSVVMQPDGKILVGGYAVDTVVTAENDFALVRYHADGTLDTTFSGDGKLTTALTNRHDYGYKVALQADGKIVLGGSSFNGTDFDFAAVRYEANGALDTTFNGTGKVTTTFGSGSEVAYSLAIQPDGRLVLAGYASNGANNDFALARFLPTGALDTTFGGAGKVVTPIGFGNDYAYDLKLQPNGKIVVAGSAQTADVSNYDFAVARYDANGSLDTTFPGGGKFITATGAGNDEGQAVALQSDGGIVVAGYATNGSDVNFALLRYSPTAPTAAPEISVQTQPEGIALADGKDVVDFGSVTQGASVVRTLTVSNLGSAVLNLTGITKDGHQPADFTVGAAGSSSLAPGQSTSFTVTFNPGGPGDRVAAIHVASDDADEPAFDIVLQGQGLGAGQTDLSLQGDGVVTTDSGSNSDYVYDTALQADGKILLAGTTFSTVGTDWDFALVRYNPDGTLDGGFGTGGRVFTAIGPRDEYGRGIAIQTDGKILVAGYAWNGSNYDFAVVRYNSNGTLDTTFNTTGKVMTPVGTGADNGWSIALQSDGKIVVAGHSMVGANNDFAVVRYNSDGTLDTTFNGTGKATTAIGAGHDYGYDVGVQADGKIVLAGSSNNGSNFDFAAVRYDTSGVLDTTFNATGKVTSAIGAAEDVAYSLALQADGRIVLAGYASNGVNNDFALVRYNLDGSLDTTFNATGKALGAVGGSDDIAYAVTLQSDGKILLAGTSWNGVNHVYDFSLARFNPNGTLDTGFLAGGKVVSPVGTAADEAHGVVVQPDGKIVVGGFATTGTNVDFAWVRYEGGPAEIAIEQPIGTNLLDGGSRSFGTVAQGASSSLGFSIKNFGTVNLTGLGMTINGTDAAMFTVATAPVSPVTGPAGETAFTVQFTPTSADSKWAVLHIGSNDPDEGVFDIALTGTGMTGSESWRVQYFGNSANSGNGADTFDADFDGIVNLLEFATHTLPTTSNAMPGQANRSGGSVEFFYTRAKAAMSDGVQFSVEWSDDLTSINWSTEAVTESLASENSEVQNIKAVLPAGSIGRRFVRLRVTR